MFLSDDIQNISKIAVYKSENETVVDIDKARFMIFIDNLSMWIQLVSAILSYFGNSVVIYAYYRKKIPINRFLIMALAVFDLLYSTFQFFPIHRRFNQHRWVFGNLGCKAIAFSSSWIAASIYTIVIIAVEWHRSVVHPFKQKLSKTNDVTTITLITGFSMFIQAPNMLHMKNVDMLDHKDCVRDWPPSDSKYWDLFFFHISFLFPVTVMTVSSSLIVQEVILKKVRNTVRFSLHFSVRSAKKYKHDRKMITLLLMIITAFMLSTFPNQIQILWFAFCNKDKLDIGITFITLQCLSTLVHVHAFLNPVIYSMCDSNFRKMLLKRRCQMSHENDKIKNLRRLQQLTATMIDESILRQHERVIFVESNHFESNN